ncbi:unnamed protein product (macronuclear) [Paramecium tetraurelia]|uniref:Centrosomal protein of 162 kDa n=1 Tax=Paramecium tetraurelia TaxID=5888 RepID=A0DZI7_PARTE|nr:uncharacterized protein GSPATT00021621001 [Paramecium tetraurelia]CAK88454.1 unnamed protein product [Paramecium tetraurelia]|eukprot:XP_001455851.1 hypothetical protein (macronuclear) [Paramecium tetraurelia strain d4-2]
MQSRESRLSQRAFSSNSPTMSSAYASAMKSMQDKLRNDNYRKSIDLSPQDIIIEQLKQQVNELSVENDRLQMQLMKVSQEMEMNNRATSQIELLQVERLQHLKDYQERVSELIRKNEELKHDKHEIQMSLESLQRQLQAYKSNEKGLLHKVEMKKFEENSILLNTVQEYKQKIDIKDNIIKKLEKRVEYLELEKQKVEQDFDNYKQKHSTFKQHEFEKQISNLKYQLDEKDRVYLKNIDEAQSNRLCREEQMAKRIQELSVKSSEYQDIIQQLTIDYKDLNVKYQSLKIKLEQEEKSHKYLKRRISRQEETEFNQGYREQRTISKLNLDQISPTLPSPRDDQSLRQSQLKQAIRDCLVDMKNSGYSPDKKIDSRKRLISPLSPQQHSEIEAKLKNLNEKYENLIRQAQRESDFKNKAVIRKQLLEIAEQMKETTKIDKIN